MTSLSTAVRNLRRRLLELRPVALLGHPRSPFARDLRLAASWAELATVAGDWDEAAQRWAWVLDRFGTDCPARMHRRLARARRKTGVLDQAEIATHRALKHFPDDPFLLQEWAAISLDRRDWSEAVKRWRHVIELLGNEASPAAWAALVTALRRSGHLDEATSLLASLRREAPSEMRLAGEAAHLAEARHDWDEALRCWQEAVASPDEQAPATAWVHLAREYRHRSRLAEAEDAALRGLAAHPHDIQLLRQAAELAMVAGHPDQAVERWGAWVRRTNASTLPHRATDHLDWVESDWAATVEAARVRDDLDTALVTAMARTMIAIGDHALAARLLDEARRAAPDVQELVALHLLAEVRAPEVQRLPTPERFEAARQRISEAGGRLGALIDQIPASRYRDVFATHAPNDTTQGIGALHLLNVPKATALELFVHSEGLLDRPAIADRLDRLALEQDWARESVDVDPVSSATQRTAATFGERFAAMPYTTPDTLADAIHFPLHRELQSYLPLRRLAIAIAEQRPELVFVQRDNRDTVPYLRGGSDNPLAPFYLCVELRRLGVNAILVQFVPSDTEPRPGGSGRQLQFVPDPTFLQARVVKSDDAVPGEADRAVVPAGIRSVRRLEEHLEDALLYSGSSLTQEFAYDRSRTGWVPIRPRASVLPDRSLLRTRRIELQRHGQIAAPSYLPGIATTPVPIDVSDAIEEDWLELLAECLGDYLEDMARRCHAEVALRRIEEIHVCDHLYVESSMFASAVRRTGGRVVLWPHSANPVHVRERRPGSFDEVHAVTQTGHDMWKQAFPGTDVVLSPWQMLGRYAPDAPVDPGEPLSVVVIGGQPTLGAWPYVDRGRHRACYRGLFTGLEQLQSGTAVRVFFKPKGATGENEAWLRRVVGDTANWRAVKEHPRQLSLPNMLFVTVSMGTSALLEGLARGIPCAIVREGPVLDYSTIHAGAVPIASVTDVLEVVRRCAEPDGRARLLEAQAAYYRTETGDAPKDGPVTPA